MPFEYQMAMTVHDNRTIKDLEIRVYENMFFSTGCKIKAKSLIIS